MAHLVFQTAYPGDLFLSIPLLKRVRNWDPGTPLVLACRPGLGEYFLKSGLVDEVLEIDKKSFLGRRRARALLRARRWDAVFVPHESFRTALWMWPVRAKFKVGFRKWWNFLFYSRRVTKPKHLPDALRQLSLLAPLDAHLAESFAYAEMAEFQNPMLQPSLQDFHVPHIPDWASMRVEECDTVSSGVQRIFLAPGSVWDTKRWSADRYIELGQMLAQRGFAVELVGSTNEKELCERVVRAIPGAVNHAGQTTLAGLVALLKTGTALICNDSGAMHAAAAVGLPTLAIFGPTTLAQGFRPWQNEAMVVQRELKCRPCGRHGGKVCPLGTHECMEKISALDILTALEKLL